MTGTDLPERRWHKSTYSDGQANCVEIAILSDQVAARDSKDRNGSALVFTAEAWSAFVEGVTSGEFTQP